MNETLTWKDQARTWKMGVFTSVTGGDRDELKQQIRREHLPLEIGNRAEGTANRFTFFDMLRGRLTVELGRWDIGGFPLRCHVDSLKDAFVAPRVFSDFVGMLIGRDGWQPVFAVLANSDNGRTISLARGEDELAAWVKQFSRPIYRPSFLVINLTQVLADVANGLREADKSVTIETLFTEFSRYAVKKDVEAVNEPTSPVTLDEVFEEASKAFGDDGEGA